MPTAACPNCLGEVEIAADRYGRRVVCPHCDQRFTPEPPRRRARDRDDTDEDEDDRPRRRSRADTSKKALWVLLAVGGGLLGLGCLGCLGFLVYVNKAKVTFDGPWADHAVGPPGRGAAATASFPKPPVSDALADYANGGTGALVSFSQMDHEDSLIDAVFALGYVEYPPGTANPLDRGYLPIREQLSERFVANPLARPKIKRESPTTAYGYPAKEVEYSTDDGGFVIRVVHVTDRPRTEPVRLVVVLVGGTGVRPADRDKFLQSVRVGRGK